MLAGAQVAGRAGTLGWQEDRRVGMFAKACHSGHGYIGHNYIGYNYIGHNYMGREGGACSRRLAIFLFFFSS